MVYYSFYEKEHTQHCSSSGNTMQMSETEFRFINTKGKADQNINYEINSKILHLTQNLRI